MGSIFIPILYQFSIKRLTSYLKTTFNLLNYNCLIPSLLLQLSISYISLPQPLNRRPFLYKTFNNQTQNMKSKLNWSEEEEGMLKLLGSKQCKRKWVDIAKQINTLCPEKQRTSKQCREKYINHVQYENKEANCTWTKDQQHFLFSQYLLKGSKWKVISSMLPGKSENTVKNKFYGKIRKLVRRLNNICRERINRSNKPLRDQSVMRIIDIYEGFQNMPEFLVNESSEIKKQLLKLAEMGLEDFQNWSLIEQNNVVNLIKKIHKFNINSRYFCSKKKKSQAKRKQNHHQEQQKVQTSTPINEKQLCLNQTTKLLPTVEINMPKLNTNILINQQQCDS